MWPFKQKQHYYLFSYTSTTITGHIHINMTSKYSPNDTIKVMNTIKGKYNLEDTPTITNVFYFGKLPTNKVKDETTT